VVVIRDIADLRQVYDEAMSSGPIVEASVLHTGTLLQRFFCVNDTHLERVVQSIWTAVCASTRCSPFEVFSWFVRSLCRGSAIPALLAAVTQTVSKEAGVSKEAAHQFLDALLAGCKIGGHQLSTGECLAVGQLEHWLVDAVFCDCVDHQGHHEPTVSSILRVVEKWSLRARVMTAMQQVFLPPASPAHLHQEEAVKTDPVAHFPAAWIRVLLFVLISFLEFPAFWCNYFAGVASNEIAAHYSIPISAIGSLASINTVGFMVLFAFLTLCQFLFSLDSDCLITMIANTD
jgi:hypothetical protein